MRKTPPRAEPAPGTGKPTQTPGDFATSKADQAGSPTKHEKVPAPAPKGPPQHKI